MPAAAGLGDVAIAHQIQSRLDKGTMTESIIHRPCAANAWLPVPDKQYCNTKTAAGGHCSHLLVVSASSICKPVARSFQSRHECTCWRHKYTGLTGNEAMEQFSVFTESAGCGQACTMVGIRGLTALLWAVIALRQILLIPTHFQSTLTS
jgi:hypothetical protein